MTGSAFAGHTGLHALAKSRQWLCAYCRRQTHCQHCRPDLNIATSATRDHIVARSKGGGGTRRNIVLACHDCNQHKGDRPVDAVLTDRAVLITTAAPVGGRNRRRRLHQSFIDAVTPPPTWRACAEGWHKTEAQATTASTALLRATDQCFEPYRCVFCARWHLVRALERDPVPTPDDRSDLETPFAPDADENIPGNIPVSDHGRRDTSRCR